MAALDFHPLHSSHMGGVLGLMISVTCRILDVLLMKTKTPFLSHKVLVTLMSEVMAIMNAQPVDAVSSDPDVPTFLSHAPCP